MRKYQNNEFIIFIKDGFWGLILILTFLENWHERLTLQSVAVQAVDWQRR